MNNDFPNGLETQMRQCQRTWGMRFPCISDELLRPYFIELNAKIKRLTRQRDELKRQLDIALAENLEMRKNTEIINLLNEIYVFIGMPHKNLEPWRYDLDKWKQRVEEYTAWNHFEEVRKFEHNLEMRKTNQESENWKDDELYCFDCDRVMSACGCPLNDNHNQGNPGL